jgi:hypothetical protein
MSFCGPGSTEGERTPGGWGAVCAVELRMEGLWVGGQAHQGVCVVGTHGLFA